VSGRKDPPLWAVVLAAGEGRRAGGFKPLWPLGDGAVVDAAIWAASAVCDRVRVVGGACFDRLEAHVSSAHPRVEIVENSAWEAKGMFSSVRIGVRGVDGPCFVHPCDVPGSGAAVYRALVEAYRAGAAEVARPVHGGRGGHPVLIAPEVVRAIGEAPEGWTLRDVLAGRPRLDVPVDDDLPCLDFDTPEEYEMLADRLDPGRNDGRRDA